MPMNFFFRIKKCPGPVVFGIVLELKCVSRYKSFGRTYKTSQSIFIVFNKSCVHCVRSIAGHYKQNRNRMRVTTGSFGIVGQILKNKPFIQSAERSCHFRKIIWRTDNESVKVITFRIENMAILFVLSSTLLSCNHLSCKCQSNSYNHAQCYIKNCKPDMSCLNEGLCF